MASNSYDADGFGNEGTGFIGRVGGSGLEPGSLGRVGDAETTWRNFICRSTHPIAAAFHLVFKAASLILYIFGVWFGLEYVTVFVCCVLLLAADFWTVKNITGRLLVGLRWWVRPKDEDNTADNTANGANNGNSAPNSGFVSSNEWVFESSPHLRPNSLDSRIFWWGLYVTTGVWAVFASLSFIQFSFDWLLVDLIAVGLTGTNLFGYFKCSTDAQRKLRATLTSGALTGLSYIPGALPAIGNTMMNMLVAARGPAPAPGPGPAHGSAQV